MHNPKSVEFHQCHAKRHSICFYHNIKDNERNLYQDLLTTENTDSDLKLRARCIMQMSYLYASDFPFKTFCKLAQNAETIRKNVLEKSNDAQSLSIRIQITIKHISICFLPQYQHQRKFFFFFFQRAS